MGANPVLEFIFIFCFSQVTSFHLTPVIKVFYFDLLQSDRKVAILFFERHFFGFLQTELASSVVAVEVAELGNPLQNNIHELDIKTRSQEEVKWRNYYLLFCV